MQEFTECTDKTIPKGLSLAYLQKWESRSSIRSRPRQTIDFTQAGYFFPADKQQLMLDQHIQVLAAEKKRDILLQSFLKYMNDIINLEIHLINTACHKIIYQSLDIEYDEQTKMNAYTVIIDEYYHVLYAREIKQQILLHYEHLSEMDYPISDSYQAVITIKERLDKKYHDVFDIIAVCIFETTLVKELVEFFNSSGVHPSIKYYVQDHMNDESRHYGFFFDLLTETWEKLPETGKEAIGAQIADFVKHYLNIESEKTFNAQLLQSVINDEEQTQAIIARIYHGFDITPELPIVSNVITALKKSAMTSHPSVKAGFKRLGWTL